MKHKLFAATMVALAGLIGYLAHAGFPTIVPVMAAGAPAAHARLADCESSVAVAERRSDLPDVATSPPRENVRSAGGWLLDPRPMMGRNER